MPFFSTKQYSRRRRVSTINSIIPSTPAIRPALPTTASPITPIAPGDHSVKSFPSTTATALQDSKQAHDFQCQLAHGGPTCRISGFRSIKELYEKIAACCGISASDILYCTLNTNAADMNRLLGGNVGLDDVIYAHVKGQVKQVDIVKSESNLGLLLTDNQAGYTFIKRITADSTVHRLGNVVKVGDHIEKVNDRSAVGLRHFDVAVMLRDCPVGSTIKLRLIQSNTLGDAVEPVMRTQSVSTVGAERRKTLRFKADGTMVIEDVGDVISQAIDRVNRVLESYMGISDSDLAQQICDMAEEKRNPSDFASAVDESDLASFNFTDEVVFDLWAAIDDVRAGRVPEQTDQSQHL